jgi:hypothetical protein
MEIRRITVQGQAGQKCKTLQSARICKIIKTKKAGGMAQVLEYLPSRLGHKFKTPVLPKKDNGQK